MFRSLRRLDVSGNSLEGTLPAAWAAADAFPQLRGLNLSYNDLTGPFPAAWAAPGMFKLLTSL